MSDLKDRFEREMRGLPISAGGFERTLTRVRRRDRNRRLVAGFVALALVAASVLLLARTWGSTTPIPAEQPPRPAPAALGSLAYGIDGDIYVAESDGSNAVRIADGVPPNECAVQDGFSTGEYWAEGSIWSPDGRYLAYRHANCDVSGDFRWHVVISDPRGNVVAEFPGEGWDISWSPDSTRVAVWVELFETIGVFGLDGERQTLLTLPPGMLQGGDHDPVWLPDGDSLTFPWDTLVVPIDGSTPYHLQLPDLPRDGYVTYSPDGSRVAYVANRSLVVADADGSNPAVAFDDWVWEPVWSPTGDRIAFTSQSGSGSWEPNQLQVLDVATGNRGIRAQAAQEQRTARLLAESEESDFLSVIDFSPEGDRILFSKIEDRQRGPSSLWSVKANGSDPRRLVTGTPWGDWLTPR